LLRDVFDLWYLLSKRIAIDWNLVNLKMSFYDKKTDVKELIEIIKGMREQEIQKDLTKFLPLNQRTTVAKVKIWLMEKLGDRE